MNALGQLIKGFLDTFVDPNAAAGTAGDYPNLFWDYIELHIHNRQKALTSFGSGLDTQCSGPETTLPHLPQPHKISSRWISVLQLGHNSVAAFQQHADIVANPAVVQPALYSIDP